MNLKTLIGQLQVLAILEGISYISFGITMPLKYMYGLKGPNYVVGILHGALFIGYCLWVVLAFRKKKVTLQETFFLLISSVVPFMTFWAERRILKNKG
jgi:integral membrane protein